MVGTIDTSPSSIRMFVIIILFVVGSPPQGTDGLWAQLSSLFTGDFMIRTELDSASNVGYE